MAIVTPTKLNYRAAFWENREVVQDLLYVTYFEIQRVCIQYQNCLWPDYAKMVEQILINDLVLHCIYHTQYRTGCRVLNSFLLEVAYRIPYSYSTQ